MQVEQARNGRNIKRNASEVVGFLKHLKNAVTDYGTPSAILDDPETKAFIAGKDLDDPFALLWGTVYPLWKQSHFPDQANTPLEGAQLIGLVSDWYQLGRSPSEVVKLLALGERYNNWSVDENLLGVFDADIWTHHWESACTQGMAYWDDLVDKALNGAEDVLLPESKTITINTSEMSM